MSIKTIFLFDNQCSVLTLGWRCIKIKLYQLSQSRVLTIFMLVLTRGSSLRLSSVFIYSPGSLSIITRLAVEVHIIITRHVSVALPMFVCNVISGHFNPIHFTNMSGDCGGFLLKTTMRLIISGRGCDAVIFKYCRCYN